MSNLARRLILALFAAAAVAGPAALVTHDMASAGTPQAVTHDMVTGGADVTHDI